jgi:hypothetical protein
MGSVLVGRRHRGAGAHGPRGRDEPIALTVNRLDEPLRLAVVAENGPRRLHAARDGRVRDDASVPNLLDELVLGDEALAVLHEQRQECKHLGLEAQDPAALAQLHGGEIQLEVGEGVDHPRLG